jgi:hypothetical protein
MNTEIAGKGENSFALFQAPVLMGPGLRQGDSGDCHR